MAVFLAPMAWLPSSDANGDPYSGAKLFTYQAGSSTKEATYTTVDGDVAQTNPIILNSRGLPDDPIWLSDGVSYKFVLAPSTDTDPPASPIETVDDVSGINDTAAAGQDQWIASGLTPTYVSATQFTLAGDQTSNFHVDRRVKTTNSGGTVYGYISASSYSNPNTTVTVVNDSGSLDSGLSAVSYGLLTKTNSSIPTNAADTINIVDNSVTLAKMASGTAGYKPSYDGSGDPEETVDLKWVKWGDSGQLTTGTSQAFTGLPSSATKIEIVGTNLNITTSDQVGSLVVGYGATPTYITAAGDYIGQTNEVSDSASSANSWSTYAHVTTVRTGVATTGFKITMDKINDGADTWAVSIVAMNDPGAAEQVVTGFGRIKAASLVTALTAVKFEIAANAFSDGYITAYYYGNANV